jgi:GMP synthase-like glutamine amidotransferase
VRLHLLEHDPIDYARTNVTLWAEKKGYRVRQTYVCNGEELPTPADFDWLMVMGGSQHAWQEEENPWLAGEKRFIGEALEAGKMILGICFGAQLLAEVLGGRVFPCRHDEIGWHRVHLTPEGRESFLFRDIPETFVTFHWHSDQFSLPPGCAGLAFSEPTPNQAFLYKGHPVAGVQFHPEFTRDLVRLFSRDWGEEWGKGPYSSSSGAVMEETDRIPDTYWLMEALLDDMDREFRSGTNSRNGKGRPGDCPNSKRTMRIS